MQARPIRSARAASQKRTLKGAETHEQEVAWRHRARSDRGQADKWNVTSGAMTGDVLAVVLRVILTVV
jgi:hypothetical protein